MNNSFYNRKIGRPACGVNNFNKVTMVNIRSDNVTEDSMYCDEPFCCLKATVSPTTGEVVEIICRKEMGSIEADCGIYIVTLWKHT
jgi:hypothetical protein